MFGVFLNGYHTFTCLLSHLSHIEAFISDIDKCGQVCLKLPIQVLTSTYVKVSNYWSICVTVYYVKYFLVFGSLCLLGPPMKKLQRRLSFEQTEANPISTFQFFSLLWINWKWKMKTVKKWCCLDKTFSKLKTWRKYLFNSFSITFSCNLLKKCPKKCFHSMKHKSSSVHLLLSC